MNILVTGASGFVATHLIPELKGHGHQLSLTCFREPANAHGFPFHWCDITDLAAVNDLVRKIKPQAVVHLAGISHVVEADKQRGNLAAVNIVGTSNVCSALSGLEQEALFLFISSALVYGQVAESNVAFTESSPLQPMNPYGHSKLAAEYIVKTFASERFKTYIVRPFNHIGPGQSPGFVCPSLARRIAETDDGGKIVVGNLNSYRDFTDVRDVVRAYRLILEKRPVEDIFILGSGRAIRIQDIFDELLRVSGKRLATEVDPALLRRNDPQKVVADCSLIKRVVGWECQIPLEKSLRDIYLSVSSS